VEFFEEFSVWLQISQILVTENEIINTVDIIVGGDFRLSNYFLNIDFKFVCNFFLHFLGLFKHGYFSVVGKVFLKFFDFWADMTENTSELVIILRIYGVNWDWQKSSWKSRIEFWFFDFIVPFWMGVFFVNFDFFAQISESVETNEESVGTHKASV